MRWVQVLLLLAVLLASPAARAQVELLEEDSQAFVQDNGAMDVIYTLTFKDNEGRPFIRKIGEFYEPVHFTRALLREGEQSEPVTKSRAV